jgi:hypothetical protein
MSDTAGNAMYGHNWWIGQLDKDEKRLKDGWWQFADKIVKVYKNKKIDNQENALQYHLNVFWSNVGVMKAALFAKMPRPMVTRIWEDQDDPVARVAGLILERALGYDIMKGNAPVEKVLRLAVEDWLVPGLGMVWLRYEAHTKTETVPGTTIKFDVVSEEKVVWDYVHWRDVLYPSARTEEEVWYIGRRLYLTRKQFEKRFDVKVPEKNEERKPADNDGILPKDFTDNKICLYELWCKRNRKIYWVSREVPGFCKEMDDFLGLENFYPCPMPLMATHATDDYLPRADYTMMRDQYQQLDELNTRITILEKSLRVVGVYDKKNAEVQRLLSDARENDMIPVDKWAVLAESGGLKGVVDWFPMEQVADVLDKLREQKAEKKQEIYELSGISDIMRGASNARETLGAQKLKAQYGSVRLQWKQDQMARFVREALSIQAEIMCEHFQDATLLKLSNIMATPDAQMAEPALQLLRDFKLAQHRIDINEQSLALPDYQQEQQTRMEFLTTTGQFLSQAAQMVQAVPGALPHLIGMIRWVAAGFRGSQEIEGVLDAALKASQGAPNGGVKPEGEGQQAPEDVVGAETVKQQGTLQAQQIKGQQKLQEIQLTKDLDLRNQMQVESLKHEGDMREKMVDAQQGEVERAHDMQMNERAHEQAVETANVGHEHNMETTKLTVAAKARQGDKK